VKHILETEVSFFSIPAAPPWHRAPGSEARNHRAEGWTAGPGGVWYDQVGSWLVPGFWFL